MPQPSPSRSRARPSKTPTDQRDPEVLAFLKAGRTHAALKRLKHIGRAAGATDVVRVITEIAQNGGFQQSRDLVVSVLDCVGPLGRLEPSHKATIRAALTQHGFEHSAIADLPAPSPRLSRGRTNRAPIDNAPHIDAEARTFV